jgi:hypothetical protein
MFDATFEFRQDSHVGFLLIYQEHNMTHEISLNLTDELRAIRQAAADYRAVIARPEFMAEVEFSVIFGIVRRAIVAGYSITVIDDPFGVVDGEQVVTDSRDAAQIIGALCSTSGDLLKLRDATGKRAGWIQLIYNGDEDVVADHSPNLPASILHDVAPRWDVRS